MLKIFKDTTFYESLESLLQKVKITLDPESTHYLKNGSSHIYVGDPYI